MTEGGWDRPRNRARTLGERDGNNKPLAEGNEDVEEKYGKDGDIPDKNGKYAIGVDGVCVCACFWPPVPKWGSVKHEIPISSPPLDDIPSIP